jgi:hypothetical protein
VVPRIELVMFLLLVFVKGGQGVRNMSTEERERVV